MKSRIAVLATVALAASFQAAIDIGQSKVSHQPDGLTTSGAPNQATNPPYLREMPSVERVKAEIKGSDPVDTSARQSGAFQRLQEIIKFLAGPRFQSNEFTPDESRLIKQYFNAWQRYLYKDNSPPPQDQPRWSKLRAFYETDPGFLNELLQRFFSPEFRTEYSRVTGKQPPSAKGNQPNTNSVITSATPQQTGGAVLSLASGLAAQAGGADPLAGRGVLLLKESFESFLRRTGMFQGPPGSTVRASPLAAWAYSCRTGMPVCQQALYEAQSIFVTNAKMDPNAKATFPGVPPGTYYLLVQAIGKDQHLVWDLRVDLKPGANSVALDQRNIAPLNSDPTRAKSSSGVNQSVADSKPCQITAAPRVAQAGVRANSALSVRGAGYIYTYTQTDRRTGAVKDSFTERGNFTNTTLYLLDEDAEGILQRAGIEPGLLGSRLAMFTFLDAGTQVGNAPGMDLLASLAGQGEDLAAFTNDRKAEFECVMKAIRAHSVAEITTDVNARGTFPSVASGTYYLFGRFYRITKPVRGGGVLWNLEIELKPGQNALTLSVNNAALK